MEIELRNLEISFRNSKVDDPLTHCCQSLSQWERNGVLKDPVKRTLCLERLFEICAKHKKYHNDVRLFEIMCKLAETSSDPAVLYSSVFEKGLFVKLAEFYTLWASELERCGDTKMACEVYRLGIDEAHNSTLNLRLNYNRIKQDSGKSKKQLCKGLRNKTDNVHDSPQEQMNCNHSIKCMTYKLPFPMPCFHKKSNFPMFYPESVNPGVKYMFDVDKIYPKYEVSLRMLMLKNYNEFHGIKCAESARKPATITIYKQPFIDTAKLKTNISSTLSQSYTAKGWFFDSQPISEKNDQSDEEVVGDENAPPEGVRQVKVKRKVQGPLLPAIDIPVGEPEEIEIPADEDEEDADENAIAPICNSEATLPTISMGISNLNFKELISSTPYKKAEVKLGNGDPKIHNDYQKSFDQETASSKLPLKCLSAIHELSDESKSSKSQSGAETSNVTKRNTHGSLDYFSLALPIENISENVEKLIKSFDAECIPFSLQFINKLLELLNPYIMSSSPVIDSEKDNLPEVKHSSICLRGKSFKVKNTMSGGYGEIYQVVDSEGVSSCLKIQQPPYPWEYYILLCIKSRMKAECNWLPSVSAYYAFKNASVIEQEFFQYGTLLNLINSYWKYSVGSTVPEGVVFVLTRQLLANIISLHSCKIIHGDLKPDNIMMNLNQNDNTCWFSIIDFGHSIDMAIYPTDTKFTSIVKTSGLATPQMQDQVPWTYEIDYYGIAAIVYPMLFGKYLTMQKIHGVWSVEGIKRYWQKKFWDNFFRTLLNPPGASVDILKDLLLETDTILGSGTFKELPKKLEELRQKIRDQNV